MSDNGRISLKFLCNLVLYFIVGELNFFLGGLPLHFHPDVLLVLFFGLYLRRLSGLVCACLLGFVEDALAPLPHGTYVVGYLTLWLFLVWGQRHIRRQNRIHVRALAALGQLVWLAALTLVASRFGEGQSFYPGRTLMEILFSVGLTYALAWPWCQFQRNLLHGLGWDIEAEYSQL